MAISKTEKRELNRLLHEILRLRDRVCLKCGTDGTLQMSHIYPKGRYKGMEYEPLNVKLLCYGCHFHFWHKNPIEAHAWLASVMPKERLDYLKLRSQVVDSGMRNYKLLKIMLENEL